MATPTKSYHERRKHPRFDSTVPLKICHDDKDVVTKTTNISRSGAYCQVEEYIAPMTKLKIHLLLPIKKNGKVVNKKITCQGVIVRTEPISGSNDFHVAIFFNEISQRDSENIADYVSSCLEQK